LYTSFEVKRSKVKVTRPLWDWVVVQVTTCRGRGHIVAAAAQAAQLVFSGTYSIIASFICAKTAISEN